MSSGGIPGARDGKASVCNAGDPGSIPGLRRSPGEGDGSPFQYSCLENPMDCGSLVGYHPWRHEESDTTELSDFTFTFFPVFLLGECHGQRSLEGYSLYGHKESDTTEQLTHTYTVC